LKKPTIKKYHLTFSLGSIIVTPILETASPFF
jgi:hypothetical protein